MAEPPAMTPEETAKGLQSSRIPQGCRADVLARIRPSGHTPTFDVTERVV